MIRLHYFCLALLVMVTTPVWPQADTAQPAGAAAGPTTEPAVDHPEDRMQTPPPVTGQNFPIGFASEERANYLRYGVVFTPAYTDNVLPGSGIHPIGDMSYTVAPTVAIDEHTPRTNWTATYAPGFTVYQKTSSRNEADQNALLNFSYRLSPHVTFNAHDAFQKTSNAFNQPNFAPGSVISGGAQVPNFSVIAPIASQLNNSANVGLDYQFALNGMIGASGTFTNLHYPDPAEVSGLSDSASQGGSAFYSLRVSKMHYLGALYQYQRLLSYPSAGLTETHTHAVMLFYTLLPSTHFSLSFFGGPQYSITAQPPIASLNLPLPAAKAWTPAAGASLNWQGRLTTLAFSYAHIISGGGGLVGAVHLDSGTVNLGRQLTRTLSGTLGGGYTSNRVIATSLPGITNGHSILGSASLEQQLGQHFSLQLGYMRIHQTYQNVAVVSLAPNTNREFISFSYQFSRPLGR